MYEEIEHMKGYYEAQVKRVLQRIDPKEYGYDLRNSYGNIKTRNQFNLTERNRELLKQYNNYMTKNAISPARKNLVLGVLGRMFELINKDYDNTTKEDINGYDPQQKGNKPTSEDLVSKIMNLNVSNTTKSDYLKKIKQFDKWFNGGECSDRTRKLKTSVGIKHAKLPDQLITPQEVEELISGCYSIRDKALFRVMWETGARTGEIINLKIKSVQLNKGEGRLNLYGKKGGRSVFIIESVRELREYLKTRENADPNEPLFVLNCVKKNSQALSHTSLNKLLKEIKNRVGIKKHIHSYLFRHSRASYLASKGLNEATLCQIFGWEIGSKQVRTYIHLSGQQVEEAIKGVYGVQKPQEKFETKIKCQVCDTINDADQNVCCNCYNPLTIQGALKIKKENEYLQEASEVLQQIHSKAFELMRQGMQMDKAEAEAKLFVAEEFANKLKQEQKIKC
jgi:integrase/recombinase XerD